MSTEDQTSIQDIVATAFPNETELLGDDVFRQVIDNTGAANAQPLKIPGGQNFDLTAVLDVIKAAAELAAVLIPIYREIKSDKGKAPTSEELLSNAPSTPKTAALSAEDRNRVADTVIQRTE
jgi:hypothetical protein